MTSMRIKLRCKAVGMIPLILTCIWTAIICSTVASSDIFLRTRKQYNDFKHSDVRGLSINLNNSGHVSDFLEIELCVLSNDLFVLPTSIGQSKN